MAYEARKETVGEQPSKCGQQGGNGPFERRTQKANTVTDAEGNCWVANRNAEWNRQRWLPFRMSASALGRWGHRENQYVEQAAINTIGKPMRSAGGQKNEAM